MYDMITSVGSHTQNASLSAAVTLTLPANSIGLLFQAITQNVRITLDGSTTPTATTGFQIRAGDPPVLILVGEGRTVKVIEETATATVIYQAVKKA